MRSYNQYCAIAKALDVIGDRWNLLIVRELLLQGPCRYTDLLHGLPGVASNLLSDRLRDLEGAGVVTREEAPPPIATTLFRLTPRGLELKGMIRELGRWGAPLMTEREEHDVSRDSWLALPISLFVTDQTPEEPPITIELRAGTDPITVETRHGKLCTRPGATDKPDLILTGAPELVVGLLTGELSLSSARTRGLRTQGNTKILARLQPEHR